MAIAPQLKPCWDPDAPPPAPDPVITGFSPASMVAGSVGSAQINILGSDFMPSCEVWMNGTLLGVISMYVDATNVKTPTFTVPATAGTATFQIKFPWSGQASNVMNYSFT